MKLTTFLISVLLLIDTTSVSAEQLQYPENPYNGKEGRKENKEPFSQKFERLKKDADEKNKGVILFDDYVRDHPDDFPSKGSIDKL